MKNRLIIIFVSLIFLGGTISFFPHPVFAVDCSVTPSGNLTISSSCAFPGTINGADAGTGTTNTASITVSNGATLTVAADQTIAVGSLIPSDGSIAIITGGQIKIGSPLWMTDADNDGYPSATTQVIQATQPTNGQRRNLMASLATTDCNDGAYSTTNSCGLANGSTCSTGDQCTSTYCVSSVCCSSSSCPARGVCQTGGGCAGGSCVAVTNAAAGTDPNNECNGSAVYLVQNMGSTTCATVCASYAGPNCNGSGSCSQSCLNRGTDTGGTNGYLRVYSTALSKCANRSWGGMECSDSVTTGQGYSCDGYSTSWTYCKCQ